MFENIVSKIKSLKSDEDQKQKEIVQKISKMNLTDMKSYVNNKIADFQICEDGLNAVMHKLLELDEKTSKRYIEIDDMDSKVKKGFELILSILKSKKITVTTLELVNEFIKNSDDIIKKYDKEKKEIYSGRFKDAINLAIKNMDARLEIQRKINLTHR